jgi:hypothetical protein
MSFKESPSKTWIVNVHETKMSLIKAWFGIGGNDRDWHTLHGPFGSFMDALKWCDAHHEEFFESVNLKSRDIHVSVAIVLMECGEEEGRYSYGGLDFRKGDSTRFASDYEPDWV